MEFSSKMELKVTRYKQHPAINVTETKCNNEITQTTYYPVITRRETKSQPAFSMIQSHKTAT